PPCDLPLLDTAPGTVLKLMVVAFSGSQCAAIDLATGVLVRVWSPVRPDRRPRAYDIVEVTIARDRDAVPDPTAPEALAVVRAPVVVGHAGARRAERLLRPLAHPPNEPLLGFRAPVVPFYERTPERPSVALVEPEGRVRLYRRPNYLVCRFAWQGLVQSLPCLDGRVATLMDRAGRTLAKGARGDRLVVALTPPMEGRCHKVVQAVLPRP
ncbi:MAG: hypothetical protein J2P58_06480, partial [Acidimicrobiaceae bacterium]|nr:hypothetical protein [Acidimicrobiaceae bacterium]